MQVGVPVVASNRGSDPRGVRQRRVCCASADDADALAGEPGQRGVRRATTRAPTGRRGHGQLATFSWQQCAADLAALYAALWPANDRLMIAVLCGGVGAARFLAALARVVEPSDTVAIVNTGDDTVLHGLAISPDLDTVTYTLAGGDRPERGWGLADETWRAMEALQRYAAVRPDGRRPRRRGSTSATATWPPTSTAPLASPKAPRSTDGDRRDLPRRGASPQRLVPMSDDRVSTMVTLADGGEVSFQEYFVRLRHGVPVSAVRFDGAELAG